MFSLSSDSTKSIQVFYDTIFHLEKIVKNDILNIYKLKTDYDSAEISNVFPKISIDFGNSNTTLPFNSTRSCYVGSLLIENYKKILIAALDYNGTTSQTVSGQIHTGTSFNPKFYTYDINNHSILSLDLDNYGEWIQHPYGDLISTIPSFLFRVNDNKFGLLSKVTKNIDGIDRRCYVVNYFYFEQDAIKHLSSKNYVVEDSNGNYNSSFVPKKVLIINEELYICLVGIKSSERKVFYMKLGKVDE